MRLLTRQALANRRRCLAYNEELRKERRTMALPDHSGHVAFQMPELDFWFWSLKYPELKASDPQIARKAWLKFLRTDEGRPYLVNPREGKRMSLNDGVIVR